MTNIAPIRATDTKHRELSWFSEHVDKGRKAPYVEITTITPTIAARLLEANDGNRPISERLVSEIAADIEHGFWVLNGETIIVSKEGLLNDGQHRLEAVLRTGRSIQTAVMWGVSREARMTVDMGRQRTAGNFLAMDGASYGNYVATVCTTLIFHSLGQVQRVGLRAKVGAPTKQEIRDYYAKHKKAIDAAMQAVVNEKFAKLGGIAPIAAAHVLLHRKNEVEATVFFARLLDGANLKASDPILWLRSRLMAERKNWLRSTEKLEIILRHWNRWRAGAKCDRNIRTEHTYPEIAK